MDELLKKQITKYYKKKFKKQHFIPEVSPVSVSGKVFDHNEFLTGVEAVLDGWWTEGHFAEEFEGKFSKFLGVRYVSLVNSGSSANLAAFSALSSTALKERALKPGDEVITAATGFPTTVNPIILKNCTPVFLDCDIATRNITFADVKKALTKKTKAIMIAHTLGNPYELDKIAKFAKENNLWLIEDCCDALGSRYDKKLVGTFGDIATFSFYPAHQITMGEGGAVVTNNPWLHRAIRQFRDWGRDCWCDPGKDNTCGRRFAWKMGDLPFGYDHKYTYSQIGYNLKLTDMQAAIGVAQLEKLPRFIEKRKENFKTLLKGLKKYEKYLILPQWEKKADPCWFGFMIVIKDDAPFTRLDAVTYLESKKIVTRSLFSGNLIRHPAYKNVKYKQVGKLANSDKVMNNGFWVGVYPGITGEMMHYMILQFRIFLSQYE